MRNRAIAALLVVGILAGAGVGYVVGLETSRSRLGLCTPTGSLSGLIPAGVIVTVSYQGNWGLSIAEFGSNLTKTSALDSVCYYEGSGTISFYVSIVNYQGWNTVAASAHKFGATGTLTLTIMFGGSSANTTSSAYGPTNISFSFLE